VCGCPTSVLDPLLQDGKKLPMWSPHSCLGCFLGYSPVHSSIVSLILNLHTDPISPQYHLVHDDWFTTVSNALSSSLTQAVWDQLISNGYERGAFDSAITNNTWLESEPSILRGNVVT